METHLVLDLYEVGVRDDYDRFVSARSDRFLEGILVGLEPRTQTPLPSSASESPDFSV